MADTDVIGVLSLLCAGAAAVYLLRARLFNGRAPAKVVRDEPATPSQRERRRDTQPPKLRSFAREAQVPKAASSRPPPPEAEAEAKPDAKKPDADKPEAKKPEAKKPEAKKPEAKKPEETTAPAPVAKVIEPALSPAPPLERPNKISDVPKIAVEEDEDLELTKMGKVRARRVIQPPVERIDVDPAEETPPAELAVFALAQTDTGRRRKQNEDSHLLVAEAGLFIVADGMGGHRGGQVASKLAVTTIADAFARRVFEGEPHADVPPAGSELARAIQMANATILEEATKQPALKGMGTTLCAMRYVAAENRLYIGHVGDSRCYRVRDGAMKQLTTDHTMADYGIAGPEGAHLSRALGVWPTVPIDILVGVPQVGDLYLLCSDGLTKMLPDGTIATQLLHEENPKAAVERLVFFANAHGGKDNITVVLVRIVERGFVPPPEA